MDYNPFTRTTRPESARKNKVTRNHMLQRGYYPFAPKLEDSVSWEFELMVHAIYSVVQVKYAPGLDNHDDNQWVSAWAVLLYNRWGMKVPSPTRSGGVDIVEGFKERLWAYKKDPTKRAAFLAGELVKMRGKMGDRDLEVAIRACLRACG